MKKFFVLAAAIVAVFSGHAATLGTFQTSVGSWDVEFFDEEKPITVSNFLKYATSGRFSNQFIHRWVPGFVIQGGGYRVETNGNYQIVPVSVYGMITNEYNVGRTFSNTYGTMAMARQGGNTNSATSQWFFNLGDNSRLDSVDGGFTVFGRITGSGTNILNLFIPPAPRQGIYRANLAPPLDELPVLSTNLTYTDLIYVHLSLRRDLDLKISRTGTSAEISWKSVAGVTNIVESASNPAAQDWEVVSTTIGNGGTMIANDPLSSSLEIYRVRLMY